MVYSGVKSSKYSKDQINNLSLLLDEDGYKGKSIPLAEYVLTSLYYSHGYFNINKLYEKAVLSKSESDAFMRMLVEKQYIIKPGHPFRAWKALIGPRLYAVCPNLTKYNPEVLDKSSSIKAIFEEITSRLDAIDYKMNQSKATTPAKPSYAPAVKEDIPF